MVQNANNSCPLVSFELLIILMAIFKQQTTKMINIYHYLKFETKRHIIKPKTLKISLESKFTFSTFKLFFPKFFFAFLHLGSKMACIINSIKSYELGINLPISSMYRYSFKDLKVRFWWPNNWVFFAHFEFEHPV